MAITKIQTVTVGSGGAASIDFTSIPNTFTDIVIVASMRGNGGAGSRNMNIRFNSSTSGYSERMIDSNGSSASAASTSGSLINWAAANDSAATANTFSNVSIYISNYAGSTNKSISIDASTENNATANINRVTSAVWANSSAITSVNLLPESGVSWVQYSSATLYGVSNTVTNGTPKATGGTITYGIGGIVYHTFTSSGTFTPTSSFTADVLVVGGGGKGASGGGGAGGYRTGSLTVSSPVTVTVGAGQAGSDWATGGGSGSASTFDTITSAGGGSGGSVNSNNAVAGGSGGGGAGQSSGGPGAGGAGNTPSTSPAQGSTGGAWNGYANNQYGAGGGGASGVGGNSNATSNGGAGGAGTTWLNGTTYAIGGKGMEANGTGASGAANTGTGGAGGFTGGSGGSGIVIVRYQG